LAKAGLTERAIEYLKKAGERAILHSATVEAISHLKGALELLQSLPDQRLGAIALQPVLGGLYHQYCRI
jgi:predicted ATPase